MMVAADQIRTCAIISLLTVRVASTLVSVDVEFTRIRVVVAIAASGARTTLCIGVAIGTVAIVTNLVAGGALNPTLRITTAVVAVPV